MNLSQQLTQLLAHFGVLGPEVFVALAFLLVVTADLIWGKTPDAATGLNSLTAVLLLVAGWLVTRQLLGETGGFLFGKLLLLDGQALFFKLLVTLAALITVGHVRVMKYRVAGEFYALLLALLLGLYLMTMAVNLLSIYLAVELVSICSYVLTGFSGDRRGAEGAVKYALFGAVSAAVMLYGMSLLYGLTASLDVTDPAFTRHFTQADPLAAGVALLLTLGGLFFKISAVPFHFWNPDVYEAAPTPIVSFFSVAPKAAGFLVLMRLEAVLPAEWAAIFAGVALLSLAVGTFSALWQREAKRLLAYSSIAQSGFVLVGLAAVSDFGFRTATFYLATYLFATMGAFFLVDLLVKVAPTAWSERVPGPSPSPETNLLSRQEMAASAESAPTRTSEPPFSYSFSRFNGLGLRRPLPAVALTLVMLALVGFPLTAGFSAKLLIFSSLWETYQASGNALLGGLLGFGLLSTVVSLAFYLKLPFLLFFRKPDENPSEPTRLTVGQLLLLAVLVLPILVLFFKADWLMNFLESL